MPLYGIEFSQFDVGGEPETGDIIVGLRNHRNTQFTFNAAAGTGTAIVNEITQLLHGFTVGQVVLFNGSKYALAQADTAADAEVIGLVSNVIDVNHFDLLSCGYANTLTGLVPGDVYFLSDVTPGLLTTTEPTTVGHISKPLFIATANTAGFFFNWRGKIIPSNQFPWTVVSSDTVMVANMGYIVSGAGTINLTLPGTISTGSIVRVAGTNVSQWKIVQTAGQSVILGDMTTTVGATGYLQSTQESDAVELLCINPNIGFTTISSMGNITVN